MDVDAMWTPAIRNSMGNHGWCDQKIAALEKENAELKEQIEQLTTPRHNPSMDPGARGKAAR